MSALRGNPLDDEFLRVRLVCIGMLVALVFLGGWLWHIQVHRGASFEQDQVKQSVRRVRIPGVRGRLFDRKENCVADNRASYNIVLYLEELRKPGKWDRTVDHVLAQLDELGQRLGTPSELDRDKLRNHIRRSLPLPLVAWRDVSDEVLARFAEQAGQTPGVDIQVDNVRLYPFGPRACHVLGYVGRADIEQDEAEPFHYYLPEMTGRSGVEKKLDDRLRGEAGGRLLRVDATGFRRYDSGQREPRSGQDVQLTLDMHVQALAEDALGDTAGSVVVLDPRNGDVLALVSKPGFDPNQFVPRISTEQWRLLNDDPRHPLINRAVAGGYPPGSTFKPVTALAGLENNTAHAPDVHSCPGYFQLGSATFRCWYHSGHGALNLRQAVERSCNVYFFHVGLQTGVERLAEEARAFGLGSRTGIELDFEAAGLVPDTAWKRATFRDGWRDGDTCNMSIGQGALVVTPLQMASLTATLANGGKVYRPRLVRAVREPGTPTFIEQAPDLVRTMTWRSEDIELVRSGLRDVVNGSWGTARKVALPGVVIAGKTGTAEYGRKDERKRHAWMIAFAPYEQPRYAVAILVDEGVSGGETAAPRMRQLMTGLFAPNPQGGQG
jgi:penicillin-binding protein 2